MLVRRIELYGGEHFTPAWEVSPESGARGGAAIFHGYGSAKESMLGLALVLSGTGLVCTVPDVCGHGEHPEPFGPSLLEDVRRTVRHARSAGPVLAAGHSMGARLAMLADADAVVAISPALPVQPSPEGMYALRTFATPRVRQARPGQVVEILRDLPMRPARTVPVLVLLGEGDIPSIQRAAEDLVSSLEEAELVRVAEGMVLEAEEPPAGFGSYVKHWTNHQTLPATRTVATEAIRWVQRFLPGGPT
jgi:pimeloyl-ACP methyl ester carboxylesterase